MTDRSAIYRHVSLRSVTCKVEVMPIDLPSIVTHVNTRFGLDARIKNEAPCERAFSMRVIVNCDWVQID